MANIINLTFSNTVELEQEKFEYTGDTNNNTDIGWFLGTSGGATGYINIQGSGIVTSSHASTDPFDRVTNTGSTGSDNRFTNGDPYIITFNDYLISITRSIHHLRKITGFTSNTFNFQYFDDRAGSYLTYFSNSYSSNTIADSGLISPTPFSDSFRITLDNSNTWSVWEVYLYGFLRRKDGEPIGFITPPTTFNQLKDINNLSIPGQIGYDGFVNSNYNAPYTIRRETLTGTFNVTSTGSGNVNILNPNGANRTVNLNANNTPRLDHYIRLVNIDGAFALNVYEFDGGPFIVELSNVTGILTAEFIYNQTDNTWEVTY